MIRLMLALLALLQAVPAAAQERGVRPIRRKLALVVGVAKYPNLKDRSGQSLDLPNAAEDARALARVLRTKLGFQVVREVYDPKTRVEIRDAVVALHNQAQKGDLVLFYFSGHGAQPENDSSPNYLIPSQFDGRTQFELREQAYPSAAVVGNLEASRASLRIVVIDACRDNPFTRSAARGEPTIRTYGMPPDGAEGTLIAYAAKENQKALEESSCGRQGMYMCHLLRQITRPGAELLDIFRDTAEAVYAESSGAQLPVTYGQVLGRFFFLPQPAAPSAPAPAPAPPRPAPAARVSPPVEISVVRPAPPEPKPDPPPKTAPPPVVDAPRLAASNSILRVTRAAGSDRINSKDGQVYVWIPPGDFDMGCSAGDSQCDDNEKPRRRVTITNGFWLGKTEASQDAYVRVTGINPSRFRHKTKPVDTVSWTQARDFCAKVGGRLPTEAEWEYAARASSTGPLYSEPNAAAWYRGNSRGETHPAGKRQGNAWGLLDMLGNVSEWVADWHSDVYYRHQQNVDPQGPPGGTRHAYRGGDWNSTIRDIRVSARGSRRGPTLNSELMGFRCALPPAWD